MHEVEGALTKLSVRTNQVCVNTKPKIAYYACTVSFIKDLDNLSLSVVNCPLVSAPLPQQCFVLVSQVCATKMRFPLTLRVHKPACQLGHGLRSHGSSGVRRVTAFASSNTQQEGLEKALETSSAIGTAAFNVLYDEAVDIAADASRVQAEHFKILSRFPEDPQGTVSEFIRDVQNRDVPSVSDLMNRTASVMVCSRCEQLRQPLLHHA